MGSAVVCSFVRTIPTRGLRCWGRSERELPAVLPRCTACNARESLARCSPDYKCGYLISRRAAKPRPQGVVSANCSGPLVEPLAQKGQMRLGGPLHTGSGGLSSNDDQQHRRIPGSAIPPS
ncbi:hypothetical protein NDU88_000267 [Pleurodeles waltl]|uniref:Uncharacterized protein n=1 Tax=Pleurodeles waltl TaxID=8319 RepID=A0AAV7UR58_PLEWA|nr:hypothetical protein NDU88_000267 [Pleurodeles waltl]